jgi:hypothetical protein
MHVSQVWCDGESFVCTVLFFFWGSKHSHNHTTFLKKNPRAILALQTCVSYTRSSNYIVEILWGWKQQHEDELAAANHHTNTNQGIRPCPLKIHWSWAINLLTPLFKHDLLLTSWGVASCHGTRMDLLMCTLWAIDAAMNKRLLSSWPPATATGVRLTGSRGPGGSVVVLGHLLSLASWSAQLFWTVAVPWMEGSGSC